MRDEMCFYSHLSLMIHHSEPHSIIYFSTARAFRRPCDTPIQLAMW